MWLYARMYQILAFLLVNGCVRVICQVFLVYVPNLCKKRQHDSSAAPKKSKTSIPPWNETEPHRCCQAVYWSCFRQSLMQGVLIVSKNLHSDVRGHLDLTFAGDIIVLRVTFVASRLLLGIGDGFFRQEHKRRLMNVSIPPPRMLCMHALPFAVSPETCMF